ncbi:MAG: SAF domain-containing protein [Candidatus Dormibacteria bacterium]
MAAPEPRRLRVVAGTAERRWRLAALLGLAAMLALAAYALVVLGPGADANQMVSVLRAAKSIHAGTSITSDELTTARLRTQDPSVLATLLRDSDRSRVLGQVAAVDVNAGDLVPADVVASQFTAGLWDVAVPVRRMPANLAPGDHVALLVSTTLANGSQVDLVYMQDVQVLGIGQGSVDLWVPAKLAPQVEWYADHGGIALIKMQPGGVQDKIPAGGAS